MLQRFAGFNEQCQQLARCMIELIATDIECFLLRTTMIKKSVVSLALYMCYLYRSYQLLKVYQRLTNKYKLQTSRI
jgi:hypothetical protein